MAATFVILLNCLAYGIMALPSSSSYLPPVEGRPASQGVAVPPLRPPVVSGPAVSGPSKLPAKGTGSRPFAVGPVVSAPLDSVPAAPRPSGNQIPANVGSKRQSSYRPVVAAPSIQQPTIIGAPSLGGKRPVVQRLVASGPGASAPIKRRPTYAGDAARRGPSAGIGAVRPITSIPQNVGQKPASGYGSRTVSVKAPY